MNFLSVSSDALRVGPGDEEETTIAEGGFETGRRTKPGVAVKPYITRLVLLTPAEVISLYMAFREQAKCFLPWFGIICLALVILVRSKTTTGKGGPEWPSVIVSSVSFVLWMYSMGGQLPGLPPPKDSGIIAVTIGIWTFVVPYFYSGEKAAKKAS